MPLFLKLSDSHLNMNTIKQVHVREALYGGPAVEVCFHGHSHMFVGKDAATILEFLNNNSWKGSIAAQA